MVVQVRNLYGLPVRHTTLRDQIMFGGGKRKTVRRRGKKGGILNKMLGDLMERGKKRKGKKGGLSLSKKNKNQQQSPSLANLMMSKMSKQIAPVAAAAMQKMIMEQLMGGG